VSAHAEHLAEAFEANRAALTGYATRLVMREDVAEELVQQAAVRALEQPSLPPPSELRAWLFRVVNHLAMDHLRRHGTWRETVLLEAKAKALADVDFVARSRGMAGTPELASIAKDHLAVCFSCTGRALKPECSAALLLKEVYGFTLEEVASVMGATFGQAKAWLQSARADLEARYAKTCSLVTQQGACFQCVELDRFMGSGLGDPLEGTARDLDARLAIVRARNEAALGPWHRAMMKLVDEVLGTSDPVKPPR
jgi:RNA polymerase sigma-70 factor (ECF subfamily)